MKQQTFLAQSYKDAWKDYEFSLNNVKSAHWDWIIITASSERQANAYRIQVDKRKVENRLPLNTRFAVIPDLDSQRVGSGGATLNALKYVSEQIGVNEVDVQKMLILHSGGDSKRIPQYSACGKLFSPIQRCLPNGKRATIFDELIIAVSGIPARVNAGMLVLPSDTVILYNPLQLDLLTCDAAGLSIKTSITEGKEHGVFVNGPDNKIARFLHKQSEATLRAADAVDASDNVDIDTGYIWFGNKIVKTLFNLICENGAVSDEKFKKFVSSNVCLSFYVDFIYPLASEVSLEEYYKEVPDGVFSAELSACRTEIWKNLHQFTLSVIRMAPAKYIHFGMTHELFDLTVWDIDKYDYLGWKKQVFSNIDSSNAGAVNNALIHPLAEISPISYIEDCIIGEGTIVSKRAILSGINISDVTIPENVVLHCLKIKNGKFVCRIYCIEDNPKGSADGKFLGTSLRKIMRTVGLSNESVWDTAPASIWNANLYPECDTVDTAVSMALLLWRISNGTALPEEINRWKDAKRYSLKDSFKAADVLAILDWKKHIEHIVRVSKCVTMLDNSNEMSEALSILEYSTESMIELEMVFEKAIKSSFPLNMRLYLALSTLCKRDNITVNGLDTNAFEDKAYEIVRDGIIAAIKEKHELDATILKFNKEIEIVELPVRINFCGSPSDAAPYCLEHGGTMFDGALLLKGKLPIHVEVKRLNEACFQLESFDLRAIQTITDISDIRNCDNPFDTFALHKAVLVATGVIPLDIAGISLESICERLGGGLYMSTTVDVPKGSGLGTSSIVAAACIKAINRILNQDVSQDCIYAQVFAAEQLMTTGGGWQDQVGGLTYGLKLMQAMPGMYQKINVEYVTLKDEVMQEIQDRFALIFSGQRRLARNILREEMNQCIRNNQVALETVDKIRKLCVLMKFELERGNITEFAKCISKQFEYVKILDKGASNTCIEYIFDVCEDLIDGKSICGAGGGGFLQVILKKGITKADLKKRINNVFKDCGVEVWDCTLI